MRVAVTSWMLSCACLLAWLGVDARVYAQDAPAAVDAARQPLGDAWWTGPMLANSAATLPQGHFLLEPYIYDVTTTHGDSYGSLTYMQYGLTDHLTVGLVPTFGYNRMDNGPNSSGVGWGDASVQAQYRFHQFEEGSWLPTMSVMLQETLPTGRYDRLGNRPADGFGSGASSTTLQLNTQTYFWMPSGRILRMRFNVGQTWSRSASVNDVSVYGTPQGFHGRARPGDSFLLNAAWEYNMNRHWVLALDLTWRHTNGTPVDGAVTHADGSIDAYHARAGSSGTWGIAPAIEYNWNASIGLLFGVRVLTGGFRTTTSITPAFALNYVH